MSDKGWIHNTLLEDQLVNCFKTIVGTKKRKRDFTLAMLGLRVQSTRLVRSVTTGLFQTHQVKLCNNRVMFLKSLIDKFHLTFKINLK